MSYTPGTNWEGPRDDQLPIVGENVVVWHKWTVHSSRPCATCAARNGRSFPVRLSRPHSHCSCTQEEDWRVCTFLGRSAVSTTVSYDFYEEIGTIPPHSIRSFSNTHGSSSSGSASVSGIQIGEGESESQGDRTAIRNDSEENMVIMAHYQIIDTSWVDSWDCTTGLGSSSPEEHTTIKTETRFVGFEIQN